MHDKTNSIWIEYPATVYALCGEHDADLLPLREFYNLCLHQGYVMHFSDPLDLPSLKDLL